MKRIDSPKLPREVTPVEGDARRFARRSFLGLALTPLLANATGVADVLERPATAVRMSSKPSMLRITRSGARLVAVGERGIVLWSDDDGRQWRQASVPVSVTLTGVQFVSEQLGWAIGHGGVVLNSTDGGQSWTKQLDGNQVIAAMQTRADELGARQGDEPTAVRAARLAANARQDGPDKPLLDLHFNDPLRGWVVGAFGLALMTVDGGRTWQSRAESLPNPKGLHFYAVGQVGKQLLLAGEQGLLLSALADGVAEASILATPYRGSYFACVALPDGGALLGGLRGTLLFRGANGDFKPLDSGTESGIVSISRLLDGPEQRLALVDQAGRLLIGGLASGKFVAVPGEAERRWTAIAEARDGTLVGTGHFGVARVARSDMGLK